MSESFAESFRSTGAPETREHDRVRPPRFPRGFARILTIALVCLPAISAGGCLTSETWVSKKPWSHAAPKPNRMVMMLSPSVSDDRSLAVRQGIMCRAYFFAGQGAKPVPANGKLVFVAYDESVQSENPSPDGLFEILPEDLPKHFRGDIVGDSYVFWLPFQTAHPTQVTIHGRLLDDKDRELAGCSASIELQPTYPTASRSSGPQIARREPYYRTHQKVIGSPSASPPETRMHAN